MRLLNGPIARGTIRTGAVLGVRLVIQAATLLVLAVALGPSGFGLYAGLGAMAVLFGTLATFGTHLTLLRDVSRDNERVNETLRTALGTSAILGPVLLVLYLSLAGTLLAVPEELGWVVLCFGSAELLFQPFLLVSAMERHGKGHVARSQVLLIQPLLLRLLVAVIIATTRPSNVLEWYAIGHLLAVVLPVASVFQTAGRLWRRPWEWRVARPDQWSELAGYGVMNASAHGLVELDKMLATRLLSLGAAGVYAAASRIVGALVLPVIAMVLAAMPRLFREQDNSGSGLRRWLFVVAGVYGIGAGVLMFVAAPWVSILLGPHYKGVADMIRTLSLAAPAMSLRATAMNVLTTLEKPWLRIGSELVGWVCVVVLAILLTGPYGIMGLVAAVIAVECLLAVGSILLVGFLVRRQQGQPPQREVQ